MSNDKLLERIQKLLALSANNSSAEEAGLAMEKAMAMMAEHNLTTGDLLRSQIDKISVKSTQSVSKPKDWEANLMWMVAEAFGCKITWTAGHSSDKDYWGRFNFIGPKVHLPLVEYSITYLLRKLVASRSEFSRKLSANGFSRGSAMTAELDGYCKGWIRVIRPKMTAMALNIDLQEAINKFVEETAKGKSAKIHDRGTGQIGTYHGTQDAKGVDINRPMDAQQQKRIA